MTRYVSEEESLEILKSIIKNDSLSRFTAHMPFPHKGFGPGVYRFTVKVMSLELLISIMEHDKVENVYFTSVAAAPGKGVDGISMNYKVYVKYHPVEE